MYKLPKALLLSGSAFALAVLTNTVDARSADQSHEHHSAPASASHSTESLAVGSRQVMTFASLVGENVRPLQSKYNRLLISAK